MDSLIRQPSLSWIVLHAVATHGYYRENIFQLEEMYLYRSIFQLYIGNMQESLADLTKSWK